MSSGELHVYLQYRSVLFTDLPEDREIYARRKGSRNLKVNQFSLLKAAARSFDSFTGSKEPLNPAVKFTYVEGISAWPLNTVNRSPTSFFREINYLAINNSELSVSINVSTAQTVEDTIKMNRIDFVERTIF